MGRPDIPVLLPWVSNLLDYFGVSHSQAVSFWLWRLFPLASYRLDEGDEIREGEDDDDRQSVATTILRNGGGAVPHLCHRHQYSLSNPNLPPLKRSCWRSTESWWESWLGQHSFHAAVCTPRSFVRVTRTLSTTFLRGVPPSSVRFRSRTRISLTSHRMCSLLGHETR